MTLYDELVARGLIAQVTDEAEIKDLINNGKATFYIGFDPTADSLHVGHFMADTERHYHDQIAQVYDPDRPVMCKILFKYRCIKRGCL